MHRNKHCRARYAGYVLLALFAVGVAAMSSASAANAASGVRYVALGDSYSSGLGAGSYIASSGSCKRSTKAYSALWAAAHPATTYLSMACANAKTTDVIATQLAPLGNSTKLVSITIGGNDIGFSDVMTACVEHSKSTCIAKVNAAEAAARTELPGKLDAVYGDIRQAAPNAQVVVLGYPQLYHVGVWYCVGLSDAARSKINQGADVLDTVISKAAAHFGFSFADVRPAFADGHELCDGSASWLHSVDVTNISQSYHPTATGQAKGYLPAFSAAA